MGVPNAADGVKVTYIRSVRNVVDIGVVEENSVRSVRDTALFFPSLRIPLQDKRIEARA